MLIESGGRKQECLRYGLLIESGGRKQECLRYGLLIESGGCKQECLRYGLLMESGGTQATCLRYGGGRVPHSTFAPAVVTLAPLDTHTASGLLGRPKEKSDYVPYF
jgi:hypothetical protein